jgi:hypothetical protein
MKITDYLFESAHPGGTYASILPSVETKEGIFRFCSDLNIPNLVDPDEYHCTLIYSKKSCPEIANEDFSLPCSAIMKGFKILGTDKKVLVMELYCPQADRLHETFMNKHGATHDYPEYIPHITVAENYEDEDIPIDIYDGDIEFSGQTISELD